MKYSEYEHSELLDNLDLPNYNFILEGLCLYDPVNPDYNEPFDDDDEPRQPREKDCMCDNCFYDRDALSLTILELLDELLVEKNEHH